MKIKITTTTVRKFEVSNYHHQVVSFCMCNVSFNPFFGRPDLLIEYLKKYKPDLSLGQSYNIDTALAILCSNMSKMPTPDRIRILEYIISAYTVDLNKDTTKYGIPPLVYAMTFGDYDLLKWLFDHGARIQSAMSMYAQTTLHTKLDVPRCDFKLHTLDMSGNTPGVTQLIKDTLYNETFHVPTSI